MGLFGTQLFEKKQKQFDTLYDFAQHGLLRATEDYMIVAQEDFNAAVNKAVEKGAKAKKEPKLKTPKELFELKTLNVPDMKINCDPTYLDEEIATLKAKLEVYGPEPKQKRTRRNNRNLLAVDVYEPEYGAKKYGREEIKSMIERLEARRNFGKVDLSAYPYTTSEAIVKLQKDHKNVHVDEATSMIPDLPKEAIDAIKDYTEKTLLVTGKKPVFYLIKEKKDQKEVARRRDPILLAQSPFGFVWQILGAWDEEIKFLDEL